MGLILNRQQLGILLALVGNLLADFENVEITSEPTDDGTVGNVPTRQDISELNDLLTSATMFKTFYTGSGKKHLIEGFVTGNVVVSREVTEASLHVRQDFGSITLLVGDIDTVAVQTRDTEGNVLSEIEYKLKALASQAPEFAEALKTLKLDEKGKDAGLLRVTPHWQQDEWVAEAKKTLEAVPQTVQESGIGEQANPLNDDKRTTES